MCHDWFMAKMIQVRNVPESPHRELIRRAKAKGQTLTGYIQAILEREEGRLPAEEVFDRIAGMPPVGLSMSAAESIRKEREARDRALDEARGR